MSERPTAGAKRSRRGFSRISIEPAGWDRRPIRAPMPISDKILETITPRSETIGAFYCPGMEKPGRSGDKRKVLSRWLCCQSS